MRGKIEAFWKSQILPFPEPGVRLIKQDQAEAFARQVDDYRVELDDAVAELDRHFGELKRAARERLGSLYNDQDYPETLRGLFAVSYDFPSVEPPDYLVALSPQLYEQERERVASRFEEAVRLAEEAFLAEFGRLVAHLTERTTGANDDGTAKVFRDSAIDNLVEFFNRFRQLNVRSNDAARRPGRRGAAGRARGRAAGAAGQRGAAPEGRVGPGAGGVVAGRPARRSAPPEDHPQRRHQGGVVMQLVVTPAGAVRCLYDEAIDLAALGRLEITRASHVEPGAGGRWSADLTPVGGPVLGPFDHRSAALEAERGLARSELARAARLNSLSSSCPVLPVRITTTDCPGAP